MLSGKLFRKGIYFRNGCKGSLSPERLSILTVVISIVDFNHVGIGSNFDMSDFTTTCSYIFRNHNGCY